MKLQKLVYYTQAWSLAWDGVPLFQDDFHAWADGPVCPALYEANKGIYVVDSSSFGGEPDAIFASDEIETMDRVLEYYGDKSPQWLSELTRLELPWQLARNEIPMGQPCSSAISKDSMQDYYGGLSAEGT